MRKKGPPEGALPGEQVKFWREDAGLSQADLAERIGLQRTSSALIHRIEEGKVFPQASVLMRIAHALGHPIVIPARLPPEKE